MSLFGFIVIFPFGIYRILTNDYAVAILDCVISSAMLGIFLFVRKTHNIFYASLFLCTLCNLGVLYTLHLKGSEQVVWAFPALVLSFYLLSPKVAITINSITGVVITALIFGHANPTTFAASIMTLIMTNLFAWSFSTQANKHSLELNNIANNDALTGCRNRRALNQKIESVVTKNQQQPEPMSLILFDIDHFKAINDEHGHDVGDQILCRLVLVMNQRIRISDDLYRIGGEEFLILPIDSDHNGAKKLAEELRIRVMEDFEMSEYSVTISLGVAQYDKEETPESWLKRADEALYSAKRSGRNQTQIAPSGVTK
ncbi:MAG: GGDEF domain-containing protein [Gammaproteobacteria bacterium]|nr:GGDEF domain-containing protein [Gammaproteobacteria bacterium]